MSGKANTKAKNTSTKVRNDDRPNGKAWKKRPKPQRVLTADERRARDERRAAEHAARAATWRMHHAASRSDASGDASPDTPAKARTSSSKDRSRGRRRTS